VIAVVPADDAPKRLKHALESDRAVDDGECTVAEGVGEASGAVARTRLRGADDHGRRRLLKTAEELQDPRAGGLVAIRVRLHRDREVDDRDVNGGPSQELGRLQSGSTTMTIDAEGAEKARKLVGEVIRPPATGGDQ
jgi:hypothetical protein